MSHSQVWENHSPVSARRDFPISQKADAQEQGTGLLGPTAHMTKEDLEPASARSQGPGGSVVNNLPANAGDVGSIPGS